MKLEIATFCPHCGEVVNESWFEKFTKFLGSSEEAAAPGKRRRNLVPGLMGIFIAGYFLYNAIERESIQGLIIAILLLVFAFRSFFQRSSGSQRPGAADQPSVHDDRSTPDDPLGDKFFCENCGTKVPGDATECPKCGMKFG